MQKRGLTAELKNFLAKNPEIKKRLKDKLIETKQREAACLDRSITVPATVNLLSEKEFYPSHLIPDNKFPWKEFMINKGSGRFVTRDTASTFGRVSDISGLTRRQFLSQQGNDDSSLEIHNCLKSNETGKVLCTKCEKRKNDKHKRSSITSNTSLSSDSSSDSAYHSINSIPSSSKSTHLRWAS